VWAPTTRSCLRHGACPKPVQALPARLVIATAQRSRYGARIAATLKGRAVVQKAATGGRGLPGLGERGRSGVGRRGQVPRFL
jgi:hypothetical protein